MSTRAFLLLAMTPPRGRVSEPTEAESAQAAVADLADAPRVDKKAIAVDHRLVISEVQLLLAEKRTSFALLRTGVSIALVPISVVSLLIATSSFWNVWEVWWMLAPLAATLLVLLAIGAILIGRALDSLMHTDRVIRGLRSRDTLLEDLLIQHGRGARLLRLWPWHHVR